MSDTGGGGGPPRVALIRVESILYSAKHNVANDNRGEARQEVENALVLSEQIRGDLGEDLRRLVGNAKDSMDSDSADKSVEEDIDSALAEAENIKSKL